MARDGGRLAVKWRSEVAPGVRLSAEPSVRYVGRSWLGVGSVLDIPQGDYWVADLAARLEVGRIGLSLNVENLGDARANTFSFGDPFGVAERNQMTPLRPRTVRLGVDTRF